MAGSTDFLSIGGGKLYIEKYNVGVLGDRFEFGLTENIMLSGGIEYQDHYNTEGAESRLDKKVPVKRNVGIKFTTTEISADMLALAYVGTKSTTAQTAGSVVDAPYTVSKSGVYFTPDQGLSAFTLKDGATGLITYVLGTDYTVDLEGGSFKILAGGAIASASVVDASYTKGARTITHINTFTDDILEARLLFESDPQSGKRFRYLFHKVTLSQSGDQRLKGTEFMELAFEGEVMFDDTQTVDSKYFKITQIGA